MGTISLEGMEFYSFHGCSEDEKKTGTWFTIDLFVDCDTSEAEDSDNISKALNYQDLYNVVKDEMKKTSNLLENVASRIKKSVLSISPKGSKVTVKILKMNPPLGGKLRAASVKI